MYSTNTNHEKAGAALLILKLFSRQSIASRKEEHFMKMKEPIQQDHDILRCICAM